MCIDFLPDGRLLVASSANRQLLRREPDGSLVPHADLDPVSMKPWNDIVVNGGGMSMSTASASTSQGTTVGTDDRDQSEKHPSALSTGLARPGWRSPAGRFRSMQLAAGWSEWGIKLAQRVCPAQRVGGRACRVGAETKLNGEVACGIDPWIAGEFGHVVRGRRMRSSSAIMPPV